jgi:hypothetical protein
MSNDRICFNVDIQDAYSRLVITSNYAEDGDNHISKKALFNNDVFYISIGEDFNRYNTFSFTLDDAEEIVRELSKAIKFLKE